ncbi:SDR family oxidoreductase [Actinomadura citrea]|uniref:NAD(P)-dependent dehydrogenase (Short-subunit alcohol dehydrogenase family) n=1 Tax=Actinomadura citrea TaxID=46158 RepID=A0A7Y9GFM4_9ACTN|nr:SDR family oxidoreductase [Actinomadura citrea]NYE15604.1 NAD(P)-dependent dehydrogenase (short-subunit alcohol dehydrogenase family) [Actinomadura citrea]GGT65982.1 short-chain dehydrogenase [Actinomadura citrea]
MTLNGERVLVCGGTSGIGAATARLFARRGADAVVTGRDAGRLAKAAADGLTARRLDAASAEEVAAFFAEDTVYDHLVLALSGGAGAGPVATLDLADLRAGFEAKFWLHLRLVQAALPRLAAGGSVTFVTASSARAALPGTAGLAAINGALEAMVPPLAAELAPLRVNAVSPGVIETPWWDGMPAEQRAAMFAEHAAALPVGRVGRPEDVAQAILMTATNGFITGNVVECNGGLTLPTGR